MSLQVVLCFRWLVQQRSCWSIEHNSPLPLWSLHKLLRWLAKQSDQLLFTSINCRNSNPKMREWHAALSHGGLTGRTFTGPMKSAANISQPVSQWKIWEDDHLSTYLMFCRLIPEISSSVNEGRYLSLLLLMVGDIQFTSGAHAKYFSTSGHFCWARLLFKVPRPGRTAFLFLLLRLNVWSATVWSSSRSVCECCACFPWARRKSDRRRGYKHDLWHHKSFANQPWLWYPGLLAVAYDGTADMARKARWQVASSNWISSGLTLETNPR